MIETDFTVDTRGEVTLPEGMTAALRPGMELTIRYWIGKANDRKATRLQRVSAIMLLMQLGVDLEIGVADGA